VATTLSSRSVKRLPASLSDPKLPLGHRTAGRRARCDPWVGSPTMSSSETIHGVVPPCEGSVSVR